MFSPIKGKYKDLLYELCQLNDGDPTKKKDFCRLYREAWKAIFKPSNYETALEKDLYHLDKENTHPVDQKLELTLWVAHKAVEALCSKPVELAQQYLKYQSLEYKYKRLQAKKGRRKEPPKRGRQLVEADDIVAKQNK
ncbi:hypothetical protein D6C77_08994 [Aureobasidium pullulans]|nr:hypothetical protein D6C77_08994 [Aureobasidium pullulans]